MKWWEKKEPKPSKRVRVKCIGCGKKYWPRSRTGWKKKIKEHVCPYCPARTPDWVHREAITTDGL